MGILCRKLGLIRNKKNKSYLAMSFKIFRAKKLIMYL